MRDAPWDGPRAVAPRGLAVRFIDRAQRSGPAHGRNLGWRAASARLVAFTDDDCRPDPGWAAALVERGRRDEAFVQGRTEPDPDERHLLGGLARSQSITEPNEVFQTCNMAYPRARLERLGGFDEEMETGDDTDLAWRARDSGAELEWAPEALVWHAVFPRHVPQAIAETWRWRHVPALLARHPEQRRLLRYGFFWKETHARLALAAAGVAASRRAPVALLAVLPYFALHARAYDSSPRGLVRAALDLPSHAAVDAVETAVTAAGAVRHRTPMA